MWPYCFGILPFLKIFGHEFFRLLDILFPSLLCLYYGVEGHFVSFSFVFNQMCIRLYFLLHVLHYFLRGCGDKWEVLDVRLVEVDFISIEPFLGLITSAVICYLLVG